MISKLQRTILIVDDAPIDREVYRRYLSADPFCQYTILEESSARAGLAVCQSRPIDGILLDFLLPDLNGLEFVAALQNQAGEQQPPVIMVTGQGNEAIAARAIKSGVEDYLVKNQITPDNLRYVLHSAIENAELRRKLKQSEERFRTSVENMLDCFGIYTAMRNDRGQIIDFRVDYVNAAACENNRMTKEEQIGRGLCEILPAHRDSGLFEEYCRVVETGEPLIKEALFYCDRYGEQVLNRAFDIRVTRLEDGFIAAWRDVTEKKRAAETIQRNIERERLVTVIAQRVRQTLDSNQVLRTTVAEVRQFLKTDRVFIYQFANDYSGTVVMESVGEAWIPILNAEVEDSYFVETRGEDYRQGRVQAVADIHNADLTDCHVELLERFQVRANLAVPILQGENLWGLLVANHCAAPREWELSEVNLLRSLAIQVGIALQQSELYQKACTELLERLAAEAQGQRDRQFIQRITEAVPGLVYVYDLVERRNVYVNRNVAALLGYTPEQIQAMGDNLFAQIMHPDHLANLPDVLEQLNSLQDGEVLTVEYQMRRADGEWRWFCGYDTVFRRGKSGLPQQTLGIAFDITDRKQMELDLRQVNERYELASMAVKGLIYDWDLQRNTVERSRGLFDLVGYRSDEAEPTVQWWQERIHPEDLARMTVPDFYQQINSIERAVNEYRVRHRNGHYLWVEDCGYMVRGEAGNPVRVVGSTMDITDRKRAEAALRQSETRLRQLVDCNLVGVLFWNVDGTIYDANDAFLNMIGYTHEDLRAGQINWRSLTPPEQVVFSESSFDQMRRSTSAIIEKNYIRKDGTLVSVLISGVMFEGSNNRGVSFVLDLTERHQAEANLRHSESLFRGIFESDLIGILFWNLDGHITDANETFLEMTGYSRDQLQNGQIQIHTITPPEYHALDEQKIQTLLETGKFAPIEKEYICKDGRRIPVLLGCAFLPGYTDRGVAFVVDISDRKQLEQERESLLQEARLSREAAETANRTKDEFLAVVSHELRSPLNPILGWTKLLRTRKFDAPTIDRALETIERNANAQNQLIEDLLDISRMIRGQLRLNLGCMDLAPLVEHTVQNLRLMAEAKQIALSLHIQPCPFPVIGDPTRLEQVLTNLLNNAIKFTPAGGRVEVRLEVDGWMSGWVDGMTGGRDDGMTGGRDDETSLTLPLSHSPTLPPSHSPTPSAQIIVTDTGKGIQPDFLPYIFERFQQADSSTTRSRDGLGLGLAIVRHLVELHGGSVTACSAGEGLGATFTVQIPLNRDDLALQPPLMSDNENFGMNDSLLLGLRILVVDDEPDSRDFMQFLLEDSGATVLAAESAQTAWTYLLEHPIDVLLSDITMPGEDGYSLIQRLRQLPPEQGGQIPAIALTALAKNEDRDRSLRAGFQHHLSKPIEPDELIQLIQEVTA